MQLVVSAILRKIATHVRRHALAPLKRVFVGLAGISTATSLLWPGMASATPNDTVYVKIVRLHGGYTNAYLALETTGTFYNPESCPWAGLYTIPPTLPGRELFQSMAISAFMSNKEVSLTIDGCDNYPRVIAIRVQ